MSQSCSKVVGVQFSIMSPEEIRKSSVAEITSRDTYINNKPVIGGLFDPRMGVLEPGLICPTDGLDYMQTPGYAGHIELARPVFYIQYLSTILKCLRCVCFKCSKLLVSKEKYAQAIKLTGDARWKYVFSLASKIKRCGENTDDGCGCLQPNKIRKENLATIFAEWKNDNSEEEPIIIKVTAEMALKILKRISDEDVSFMGFSPFFSRPDWMICQVMSVPPPAVRPSVKHDAQQRSEDDLTHILVNIIKTNKTLQEKIQNNAPSSVIDDWTMVLQYYIATQVDNKIPGIASVAQRSGRPLKSIKDRLNGKGGRMRGNLMAKRVDFSARSVITADPNISIRELGIPMKVAKNITKPVMVNSINKGFLTKLVQNGPDLWPGAKILEKQNGESITLRYFTDRNSIILEEGDIVHRHMMDGDAILFNRQPTLHRMSMMCHIARIMKRGDTFRMNVADTKPYNADFDGDEMNLHMPQDPEAESELKNLAAVPYQIVSPANNSSIIGIYQDSMLGCYQFTRQNINFTPREAMNLLMMFNQINEKEIIKNIRENEEQFKMGKVLTSFNILSQIMPPLSMKYKTKSFNEEKDDYNTSNSIVEINNSEYIRGQMDKSVLGATTKGLLQRVCNDFGNMASAKFVDDLQNIVTEYMKSSAFSVGISDLISNLKTNEEIIKVITQKKTDVKNLIDQTQIGIFENNTGKTNEEEFETQVNNILNQATSESGKIGLKSLSKDNRFITMVNAGSKGSDLNISFMISCLGQQNVDGKRIPYGFEHRTLPHFTKYDDSPVARGFVESSYINGLSPQELFFHAMGGRVGLIDTAVKTSTTGYIQRRLIKGLEDLMVGYDMTIRTNKNKIVQFSYGDDNIDTVKVENQALPLVSMSVQDIYAHYLMPKESEMKSLSNIFLKNTMTRYKKQESDYLESMKEMIDIMIQKRDKIIKNVFKNKGDSIVNSPVAFYYIINNVQGQMNLSISSLVDITPMEAFEMIEHCYKNLEKIHYAPPTELFKTLFYFYLSPKELLIIKRFNKTALTLLLDTITIQYKKAIVSPGEMVGMIAGQSIGEVSTQMSEPYYAQHKIICKNKVTGEIKMESVIVGEFCDKIIENNQDLTFNTGHINSVETLLDNCENEYYIIGVSKNEKTKWNKISHVSRHPVNGEMMKITTKSGRTVETTTSHSHLVRSNNEVVPIVGSNMKEGMRIPVCKHIEESDFITNTITWNNTTIQLNKEFGWFIGAYLAKGSLNYNEISITNISDYYIKNTQTIANQFGKNCRICEKQSPYGKTITTKFNSPLLANLLLNTCGNGSYVKHVPDFAFTAPKEFKSGLFQGYFDGDGNFQSDDRDHQIRCSGRSEQLIKDLALILNYFDIFGIIKTENKNDTPLYHLNISSKHARTYMEEIGSVLHEEKLSNLVKYIERNDVKFLSERIDKINGLGEIIAHCGKTLKLPGQSRIYGFWKNKDSIGRRTLEKYFETFKTNEHAYLIENELTIIEQAINSGVIWDEIMKIEYYTPDQNNYVYDFTVPGNQTFMTDYGVVIHNTLNSVTYETNIIVRNSVGEIQKVQIGDFIENKIKVAKKIEYYKDKDTTYAEVEDYYEIPSCDEKGDILWKRIEAVTRHPVINKDGTNTMLKITTHEEREVIATKAKSFLKLVNGKVIPVDGDSLKVGDYLPVSKKQIDYTEKRELRLRDLLPPTEYIYSSEVEKAKEVMNEYRWWSKHQGTTFILPYKRSNSFVAKVNDKLRNGCKTKTDFASNCVYTLQTNMNDYCIPENIPLDYNFGYLIGAYASEGCMTKFQISIANNDEVYFQPILDLCKQWNITTKVYKHENKEKAGWISQDLRIYNTVLCRLLEKFCGKLSHNKFISDKIIFSNKECLLGFMDAYIGGDGSIHKQDKSIVMSSGSKDLLIDIQQILNILNVYTFITKPTKVEKNNRDTLSENIHQIYTLFVGNEQAKKLASMLNMKLQYKQENLQIILNNNPKYEINRNATFVPNEIDGKIKFEKRNDLYKGVLFDKIKSIEEVPNTTNYAFDLTISDTRTFNIYNGLAMDDTFHFAGVASKSNVTRGVPRIEEILSLSDNPKNPSLTIYLKAEDETQKEKAQTIMYMLEHTKLEEIVKTIEICFDPDDLNTLIEEDKDTIEQYKAFESMVKECTEESFANNENEKSKWIIRMVMDPEIMLEKNITMDDVNFTLSNCYDEEISCVYSDYNADKLVFRIRMNEVIKSSNRSGAKKAKVNPLDQSDQIYILKNFQEQLLQNVVLRGIKGINKVIIRKIKDNMVESNGIYKKQDIWVLDTIGTNLLHVLALDFIDSSRTFSNDITEVFNVLGIEAARQVIYNELADVIEFDGTYINSHNYSVLVDRMTFTSKLISIFRHGINNDNIGPIAKASFEETPEMFLKAARHAELDTMRGVSANVMCGQEGLFGTSSFQVVLDIEEMQKLEETSEYKPTNVDEEIEKFFGAIENPEDPCGINKISMQNNVVSIQAEDIGKDNDKYNPGF
jgi:DNA-directed RNA polymerase II subunit RPB1